MLRSLALCLSPLLALVACSTEAPGPATDLAGAGRSLGSAPPPTRRDAVVDDYSDATGGDLGNSTTVVQVADPYRWLEDQDGAEVAAWTAQQNAATRAVLDAIPQRAALRARLEQLWNYARYDAPEHAGEHWFWRKNDGLQNQSVLYTGNDPAGEGEVLLDPNTLSADGTVALSAVVLDHTGARVAFATSARGSDWREWRVLDVASKTTLPDVLQWSKFSGAAWTHDGKGFFYQRYPAPKDGETYQAENKNPQLCYHVLGTAQPDDRVVYERPDQPEWGFQPTVTDDGRFLVISASTGTDRRNRVLFADLAQDGWPVQPLLMAFDASWAFVGSDGDTFWFQTNHEAPRGRVVAVQRSDAAQRVELVPQQRHVLQGVDFVGGRFVCSYLEDASSSVVLRGRDGQELGAVALPTLGTVSGFTGRPDDAAAYCSFASFTAPPTIYRYDFAAGTLAPFRVPEFAAATTGLVTERVFLQSPDGTRLCMFLVHQQGLRLDGSHPTYLWGYGGFDIPVSPRFRLPELLFCERGGIYAQAVLRGGSEYGEEWHQAGMLRHKQNVFDDFLACAEYLVRNGYTSRSHLAVGGASNGGLLVGAVLTQRPDLFGAAVPEVGVLDMLRYHQFTIGWAWASEYGRSDDPQMFGCLHRYSPLHNITPGRSYPPTLVMTGDHDDRVLPGHSYKFAAALQAAQAGPAPILLRVATDAGHGAGKPVGKLIDEAADRLAFLEFFLR